METVTINAMLRFTKLAVVCLVIGVSPSAFAGPDNAEAGPGKTAPAEAVNRGTDILDRVQAFYESSTDYKASFRQVVTTKSPRRTFTRRGTVYFKRPGMMRWDYKVPDEVYYVSDGKILWSYSVEEGVAYRLKIRNSNLFHALKFLTGTGKLAEDFNTRVGKPTKSGLVPVTLLPKDSSHRSFESITLFVDPTTGETRQTEVKDPLGNISHLWFESPSYGPLPADRFSFTPPDGVRVQEVGIR
ncbi:MAG: outer membrane lipoprotein carrier protein LolA [Deltaproteobacteria bacterium]|nr:outer membrane lipoprotein carrier protein LolA [Deltaproteobacteria bacterium]